MIIYTNEGNPLALKLLICANVAGKDVAIQNVNYTDPALREPRHLPILQLDSGSQLFSTNAACQFLLPEEDPAAGKWLEWSTVRLVAALAQNFGVTKVDPSAKASLEGLLKTLDEHLKTSKFLAGNKTTSADFGVWASLSAEGASKSFQELKNVLRWHQEVSNLAPVKAAVAKLPLSGLKFASITSSNCFGGIQQVGLGPRSDSIECSSAEAPISAEELALADRSFSLDITLPKDDPRVILPVEGKRNILITSALPYVNNVPHLGNIIGCVLSADIFARYARVAGYNTLYVCGTDEYGTATETKALAEKMTPKQICDKYFEVHNSIYRWFGIGFDYFGRTSTPEQTQIVQEMFQDLQAAGYIETQTVEQLLCQKCDRYLADRFVEGTCPHPGCKFEDARGDQCDACGKLINATELINPRCKVCGTAPVLRDSKQFFIDLPKIEPKLKAWISKVENGWTNNAKVITRSWLREGLKSRCITRDLKWGIPVPAPGFEGKVFYVWFDAPIGYLSITSRYTKDWKEWWLPKPEHKVELFQFMAKDNVPFHSVMFPATLLGIDKGHTMVSHIMATEYLNYEDGKFSKSRGLGVFGNDAQDTGIPADVWRFYLASARPEGQDSSFSWNDLVLRNNSELLNNLGNFCNRALVFCEKNFESTIPPIRLTEDDLTLLALVNREYKAYVGALEKTRLRDGIKHLLAVSRHGNQYMQAQQPWVLLKGTDDQKERAGTIIGLACNISCLLAILLFPYMPETARNLFKQLNVAHWQINPEQPQMTLKLPPGHRIGQPVPLFAKIEPARAEELRKKYGGVQTEQKVVPKPASKLFDSEAEAEKAVADQGEKVRLLKASGAEKAVWQPEVTILLELKKQLAALQAKNKGAAPQKEAPGVCSEQEIKALEAEVAKQAEKVRLLKGSAEKAVWQPEVEILLNLKKKLAQFTGQPEQPAGGKSKKSKK